MLSILVSEKIMAVAPPIVYVWINGLQEIEIITDSPSAVNAGDFKVLDSDDKLYSFQITRKTADSVVLKLNENIKFNKNYLVKTSTQEVFGNYSLGFIEEHLHYKGALGVELSQDKNSAIFRLWSPSAEKVSVIVTSPETNKILYTTSLTAKSFGLWQTIIKGSNLDGLHYQYKVSAFGKEQLALDPYAKSMAAFNPLSNEYIGVGVIVSEAPQRKYTPPEDQKDDAHFIGMELHVRDATISPDSPAKALLKGTYLGFIEALDSYKKLGVTHLQLLPLQNFYTVDENKKNYQGVATPISEVNYNWGYDPHNYFTPEGWFSSDARKPYARIHELQKMNDEIHRRGMGVILDVVYNHVYDGEAFEAAAPGMYLRRNRRGIVSTGTGAGATLESRSVMGRRLIIDSLKYWQDTFHIDGFRFDLMGFMDKTTLKLIRESLHPETILYGEAWVFTDLPMDEAVIKTDLPHSLNISAFNDTSRDAYAGRNQGRGFVQGLFNDHRRVRAGIIGGIKNHPQRNLISQDSYDTFAENPLETLNFLTIHDGFTLWDKINLSSGGDRQSRLQIIKNAYALLFTSQGRIVIHGGCEAGRSKPLYSNDPNPERAHTTGVVQAENGISHFHENTYKSADATNAINWKRADEFSELSDYIKGLISLRKALPGLRLNDSSSIKNGLRFLETSGNGVIAYLIDNAIERNTLLSREIFADKILVIHNSEDGKRNIKLPELNRNWRILADCQSAGTKPIESAFIKLLDGAVEIEAKCSAIIIKGNEN
jgi:pullulanase